jgi:hypothetical protein
MPVMPAWRVALIACLMWSAATTPLPVRPYDAAAVWLADARSPNATGRIIALYPRATDAQALAVPRGEPVTELHLTLVDFGNSGCNLDEAALQRRLDELIATNIHQIEANAFGHAIFNPQNGQADAAVVYVVGDSLDLDPLHDQVVQLATQFCELPFQHDPWVPHITATYGPSDGVLTFTGPVIFDRIGLIWDGRTTYFPLQPTAPNPG